MVFELRDVFESNASLTRARHEKVTTIGSCYLYIMSVPAPLSFLASVQQLGAKYGLVESYSRFGLIHVAISFK